MTSRLFTSVTSLILMFSSYHTAPFHCDTSSTNVHLLLSHRHLRRPSFARPGTGRTISLLLSTFTMKQGPCANKTADILQNMSQVFLSKFLAFI
ncbi:hypothetical protein EDB19DRAFT_1795653 [Suillus lakei]|nr:hypothetical protein EDB19DRAFT_1795653 [Suillus lakei]